MRRAICQNHKKPYIDELKQVFGERVLTEDFRRFFYDAIVSWG